MKDKQNVHAQQSQPGQPSSCANADKDRRAMESTGATFSVAWPGQAPAFCGRWPAACPHQDSLPRPGAAAKRGIAEGSGFSFVQISDSHIGFNKAANQDVTGTLKLALDKINALPAHPIFCCIPATSPTRPSRRIRYGAAAHQGRQSSARLSMFRANTI